MNPFSSTTLRRAEKATMITNTHTRTHTHRNQPQQVWPSPKGGEDCSGWVCKRVSGTADLSPNKEEKAFVGGGAGWGGKFWELFQGGLKLLKLSHKRDVRVSLSHALLSWRKFAPVDVMLMELLLPFLIMKATRARGGDFC